MSKNPKVLGQWQILRPIGKRLITKKPKLKAMTPKEKAEELLGKFYQPIDPLHNYPMCYHTAKQCALIAVDELIQGFTGSGIVGSSAYWKEVKQEIENL